MPEFYDNLYQASDRNAIIFRALRQKIEDKNMRDVINVIIVRLLQGPIAS